MSHFRSRRYITIYFDDIDDHGLFELHHDHLVELAYQVGVTGERATKLAINALYEVLLERGHFQSLELTAQLDYAEQMHDTARDSAASYDVQQHKGRIWLTLYYDDGADQLDSFQLRSRQHYELARHLRIDQGSAAKVAINALHRVLVDNQPYLSAGLKTHLATEAALTARGPFQTRSSLAWQLGLPDRQPWEV